MKSISSCSGRGSSVGVSIDVSVVPTSAVPRDREHHPAVRRMRHHDRRVSRQERLVKHQVNAWLGALSDWASGSAMRRTESENGPLALITARAAIVHCRPSS